MAKIVCLLVFVAVLVNSALSLKCYQCNADKADGCLKGTNPKSGDCVASQGNAAVCFYLYTMDDKKVEKVSSNCGLIPEGKTIESKNLVNCQKPAGSTADIKECRVCTTDLCNSAPAFSINLIALLCLPVMYFVTKFMLH